MTSTLEALASLRAFAGRRPPLPDGAVATRRALERLRALLYETPVPPAEAELERLRRRLLALFAAGRGEEVKPAELRRACWLLWDEGEPAGDAIPGLVEAILAQAARNPRTLRNLVHCWILARDADRASHRRVGTELARLVAASEDPRLGWARIAATEIDLFEAPRAANRLAHALLTGPQEVDELLARYGLADPVRAVSGFLERTQAACARHWPGLARRGDAERILDRLLGFALHEGRLRFDTRRAELASGLLAAWLDGPPPAEPLQRRVQHFLLDRLGDPRLRPARWSGVDPRATALFRSWLARASLRAFFEIIREFALDHQWRYRERFWMACLERGAIADAWLALARDVRRAARTVEDLRGAFGELSGGVDPRHAVILMRIGDLVFCEWSHNGRLRAWPVSWPRAPKLGRSHYSGDELKSDSLVFPDGGLRDGLVHGGAESGRWQARAAQFLRERVGLDLYPRDYMP
ncbi:MAG: hypothetical protein KatS3mg117_0355 [Geminicoccaceae bacterium]|nr:MAG: hypothetical protein KatS3mg117_0355 [Geminicoccaceae bacterium]